MAVRLITINTWTESWIFRIYVYAVDGPAAHGTTLVWITGPSWRPYFKSFHTSPVTRFVFGGFRPAESFGNSRCGLRSFWARLTRSGLATQRKPELNRSAAPVRPFWWSRVALGWSIDANICAFDLNLKWIGSENRNSHILWCIRLVIRIRIRIKFEYYERIRIVC